MRRIPSDLRSSERWTSGEASTVAGWCLQLSRAAFLASAFTAITSLVVVYRLWALATARLPEGFPGGLLFRYGQLATDPFRGVDPSSATKQTGFIDFPAIVALDVYLVATLVFAVLGYLFALGVSQDGPVAGLAGVARPKPRRPERRLLPRLERPVSRPDRGSSVALSSVVNSLRGRDWRAYQAEVAAKWQKADAWAGNLSRRLASAIAAGVRRDAAVMRLQSRRAQAALLQFYAVARPRARALAVTVRRGTAHDIDSIRMVALRAQAMLLVLYAALVAWGRSAAVAFRKGWSRDAIALHAHGVSAGSVTRRHLGLLRSRARRASRRGRVTTMRNLRIGSQRLAPIVTSGEKFVGGCTVAAETAVGSLSRCYWAAPAFLIRQSLVLPALVVGPLGQKKHPSTAGDDDAAYQQISRREFFRKVMPPIG